MLNEKVDDYFTDCFFEMETGLLCLDEDLCTLTCVCSEDIQCLIYDSNEISQYVLTDEGQLELSFCESCAVNLLLTATALQLVSKQASESVCERRDHADLV